LSNDGEGRLPFKGRNARYMIVVAIIAVSTAAILIRLSDSHPLTIAFWRLAIAWCVIVPFALKDITASSALPTRRDALLMVATGFALAAHFASWIWSFEFTKVSSSVLLVTTHPVLVSIVSVIAFKERLGWKAVVGISMALVGSFAVTAADLGVSGDAALGDLLALAGSAMAGIYILAGSRIRKRVGLPVYASVVYGAAFVALLAAILVLDVRLVPSDPTEYVIFTGLAVGPMLLGHTLYNWTLRFLSPTVISVSLLGEPVGSTVLAIAVLGELPWAGFWFGAPVVLAGIFLVARYSGQADGGGTGPV